MGGKNNGFDNKYTKKKAFLRLHLFQWV